jgi:N-methylhydantoinase A
VTLVSVDVGGTFTDVVAVRDGLIETTKVSTDYVDSASGVLRGANEVGVADAAVFNHASTHGLNALLTRRLPKVGLLTTFGHRDVLDIGNSWRPVEAIADPRWRRSFGDANRPLIPRYLRRGIRERLHSDGSVFIALDEEQARNEIRVLGRCNVEGVAVCLLHGWVNGEHEQRVAELVREELGNVPCVTSHRVSPLSGEYRRMSTTAIDAIMGIIYGAYSQRLQAGLGDLGFAGSLNFGDCAAMLAPVETAMARPSRVIFSGPAAGTTASAHFGSLIGEKDLICSDVGGTSTDVSVVIDGRPLVNNSVELEHDLVVSTLSNEITSVGAGGGSLVAVGPSGEIVVGPASAGADPGPAAYGRGGTDPTMTDACLLIGILDPERFLGGRARLDEQLALKAFEDLDTRLPVEQRIHDAFQIGLDNIAEGILDIVIRNGIDPRDFTLIAYGAAGPMLLPALLDKVKARRVIVPPHPGLFSALGLLSADMVFMESRSMPVLLTPESAALVNSAYAELEAEVRAQIGDAAASATYHRSFDGRMVGQAFETPFIDAPEGEIGPAQISEMVGTFHDVYEQRSSNRFEAMPVQAVTFRVRAVVDMPKAEFGRAPRRDSGAPVPARAIALRYLDPSTPAAEYAGAEYEREELCEHDVIHGPAVIRERLSTTYVAPGQILSVGALGELIITLEVHGD